MNAMKHILVPTDFSDSSERALSMAIDLARTLQAKLTLVHVWSIPNVGYAEALTWPIDEMEQAARRALDEVQGRTSKQLPGTEAVLQLGKEWQAILEVAKDRKVDLIVMGTHGRRGLPRLILGSVAEKVVRLSPIPVMTVGAPAPEPDSARAEH
jgi:nucleotide-binding universal stress UspA family protein